MNILLIGCGNIGHTLLQAWSLPGKVKRIVVVQPSMRYAAQYSAVHAVTFVDSMDALPSDFTEDLTVLAVKPQHIQEVAPYVASRAHQSLIVSVLAGVKLAQLAAFLPHHAKLVRMMPNVALKTGKSATLTVAAPTVTPEETAAVEALFSPTGSLLWLPQEKNLDDLTPISGCGPAYFFLLADILVEETVKLGFDETLARKLVYETFTGTASLVSETTDYKVQMSAVASKKGVTEAALQVMTPEMRETAARGIRAALVRIKELSDENSR